LAAVWQEAELDVEFLARILNLLAEPLFIKDRQFRWVLLNDAICALTGYPREQMLGKTDHDFFPPDEAAHFRAKDAEVFETGATVAVEEESITDAQGQRHWLKTTKVPVRDASGRITHLVGIIHDITRMKHAEEALRRANEELERRVQERTVELRAAQDDLVRKERLAVLGRLAGGLAHQIRNPLAAIQNAAFVIRRQVASLHLPDLDQAAEIVHDEVRRANQIISDLIDYARVRPPLRTRIALAPLVDETLTAAAVPSSIRVVSDVPADLVADADGVQVEGALGNLVRNAIEAIAPGGTLTVRGRRDGGRVVLAVEDTGPGLAPAVRARLFEPLVTTKPTGLGLGLTTARALVDNQGGTLRCTSEEGRGAVFEMSLPAASDDVG
jgi:PAS domain S-box-containing protein